MLVNKLSLKSNFVVFAFIWVFTSKTLFILSSKQKSQSHPATWAVRKTQQLGARNMKDRLCDAALTLTVSGDPPRPLITVLLWVMLSLHVTALNWWGDVWCCRDVGSVPCPTLGHGTLTTSSHRCVKRSLPLVTSYRTTSINATMMGRVWPEMAQWICTGQRVLWRQIPVVRGVQ